MIRKLKGLNDPSCKATAFEDLMLGLVIIHRPNIDRKDLLKIKNIGIFNIDLNGGRTSINGFCRESFQNRDDRRNQNDGNDHPLPLPENFQIVSKMNLLLLRRKDRVISLRRMLIIRIGGN